jgi:hypothetical protein
MKNLPLWPFLAIRTIVESVSPEESMSNWGTNPPRNEADRQNAEQGEKPGWHTNYAKANNGRRDAPSFNEKAVVPLPALFTRSCCFHHALSTTSSATRATKSLQ